MTPQRQAILDMYPDDTFMFLEGPEHDVAILGAIYEPAWGRVTGPVICYDAQVLIELLGDEWFSVNTAGGWYGGRTPFFLYRLEPQ